MENANGREEGESGNDDLSVRSSVAYEGSSGRGERLGSAESMANSTPPGSPGRLRSPMLFAPQVPSSPLQRPADASLGFNHTWMNEPDDFLDLSPKKGIPVLIAWSHGGKVVAVEGSWDNWKSRRLLERSGKDHSILLVLESGVYHYRFLVDGQWRYIPDRPHVANEAGPVANLLDVTDYVPENLESISEFEGPPSPDSSYGRPFPVDEDFSKEPPLLPQQLHLSVLQNDSDDEAMTKPQSVVLNHLFIEKGWASQSLVALGLTHRFESKYVTVVLYKPLRR